MKMKIVSEKMKYEEPRIEVVNLDLGEGVCQASTDYNTGVSSWGSGSSHHEHVNIEDEGDVNDRWSNF